MLLANGSGLPITIEMASEIIRESNTPRLGPMHALLQGAALTMQVTLPGIPAAARTVLAGKGNAPIFEGLGWKRYADHRQQVCRDKENTCCLTAASAPLSTLAGSSHASHPGGSETRPRNRPFSTLHPRRRQAEPWAVAHERANRPLPSSSSSLRSRKRSRSFSETTPTSWPLSTTSSRLHPLRCMRLRA